MELPVYWRRTAGFGDVIYDNQVLLNDANDVSMRHLRRLHFNYVGSFGTAVSYTGQIQVLAVCLSKVSEVIQQ